MRLICRMDFWSINDRRRSSSKNILSKKNFDIFSTKFSALIFKQCFLENFLSNWNRSYSIQFSSGTQSFACHATFWDNFQRGLRALSIGQRSKLSILKLNKYYVWVYISEVLKLSESSENENRNKKIWDFSAGAGCNYTSVRSSLFWGIDFWFQYSSVDFEKGQMGFWKVMG